MNKWKIIGICFGFVVLCVVGLGMYKFNYTNDDIYLSNGNQIATYDATYVVDGVGVSLKNGISEKEVVPGSASKIVTRYFGNEVAYDFDKNGTEDTAFLITHETGGSGTFFYLVAVLHTQKGNVGSQAFFLGDRIAPQSTSVDANGVVTVSFAERMDGEDFSVRPSVGKSLRLKFDAKSLSFNEDVGD